MASPAALKYAVCGAMLKPAMRPIIKLVKMILSNGAKSMPKSLRSGFISIVFLCSSTRQRNRQAKARRRCVLTRWQRWQGGGRAGGSLP
jgi:hypothetical protein